MKSRSNIFCDIIVVNEQGKVKVSHRKVPIDHVEWLAMAPHLTVKVLKKYKIDFGYRGRNNFKRNKDKTNLKGGSGNENLPIIR